MNNNKEDLRAINIVKNLFKGVTGNELAREDIKITDKTFYNYSPLIQKYGLVEMITDEGLGKKILAIRLTHKGKAVISGQQTNVGNSDPSLSLDALGEFIDVFNNKNKYWQLTLARKEVDSR